MELFVTIRFLDILDILLVAFLLYQLYTLIKGTAAFSIFMGIFMFYIVWLLVDGLNMELMGSIIGQVMGVGVLALIIVFQQEIRKAFMMIGSRYNIAERLSFDKLFTRDKDKVISNEELRQIVAACQNLAKTKTGALIVLTNRAELNDYVETGEKLNARLSTPLLETIFFKNSPLHDGAVIVRDDKILAARCILPVTKKRMKNAQLGLRHRSAVGMSQSTDALVVIVSEETGAISYAFSGKLKTNVDPITLTKDIEEKLEV